MKRFINWIRYEESGQGMVEYSLIIALVALIVIGAVITLGTITLNLYEDSIEKMP